MYQCLYCEEPMIKYIAARHRPLVQVLHSPRPNAGLLLLLSFFDSSRGQTDSACKGVFQTCGCGKGPREERSAPGKFLKG